MDKLYIITHTRKLLEKKLLLLCLVMPPFDVFLSLQEDNVSHVTVQQGNPLLIQLPLTFSSIYLEQQFYFLSIHLKQHLYQRFLVFEILLFLGIFRIQDLKESSELKVLPSHLSFNQIKRIWFLNPSGVVLGKSYFQFLTPRLRPSLNQFRNKHL